ncbi:hypothetical protein JHK87_035750 [Glycine soja]|nr:hypothetical protein JHK87_035750 [Glycine soja]
MRHSWVAYYSLWRKFKPSYSWNLSFVDTLEKWCQICQKDIADPFQGEPVSRAVLVMIHSPRNSISSHARFLLLDVLNAKGLSCLKSLI